ncbi:MAG: hypothetical protein HGA45_23345 [Chloroflexales bacterium]|nr:hypothetical protein [Chloroflexales bacterium]
MATVTHDIRGIPLWLLRDYLIDLDGQAGADNLVAGPGWRAQLTRLADFRIGSLRVGEVRLELSGDDETIARLERALWPKLLRGGG